MPRLLAHIATIPNRGVPRRSWFGHDASHGEFVGRSHRRGQPSVVGAPLGFVANAAWRTGSQISAPMSQAAYWASWADALHVIEQRLPRAAENIVTPLEDRHLEGCLGELQDAARSLDLQGFVTRPSLAEFSRGKRPPFADSSEPGEWQHGWQFYASEQFFRETVVFAQSWSGQRMNGRWRCWRQGSPSTRERSWKQRMVQCWSEPVPTKRRRTPSSQGNRCHLVVVGLGRWSTEATTFVDLFAREVPHVLRRSTHQATWRGTEGARLDLPALFGEL